MVQLGGPAKRSDKCQPAGGFNVGVVRTVFLNGFGDKSQSLKRLCVRAMMGKRGRFVGHRVDRQSNPL